MRRSVLIGTALLMWFCIFCGTAMGSGIDVEVPVPAIILNETFIYDELDSGTGTSLYTLIISEDGYRLYCDNVGGLLSAGKIHVFVDKRISFEDGVNCFEGSYRGSAFESPAIELEYMGEHMEFRPGSENAEYVYLSRLGVYEGEIQGKQAVLILERWFEYYLYVEETLHRGTYEIHADGTVEMLEENSTLISGTAMDDAIELETPWGTGTFRTARAKKQYTAAHAMGEYTLSVYTENVFTIHGVDGLLKAMGTLSASENGGTAMYFPRMITNNAENDEKFAIQFEIQDQNLIFPDSTYLLPRSGNIDEKTGFGSYWSAGTTLEFIEQADRAGKLTVEYEPRQKTWEISDIPLESLLADSGLLKQSMPSLGTAKPLALLIDFPDQHRPRFITAQGIEAALFSLENEDSLSVYYFRSSYGNLTIDGTVLDWYRMEKNRSEYVSDKEIIREAIEYHMRENGLDLADYDSDGDGEVDSLYVLWAGDMDSSSGMWSSAYRSSWNSSPDVWGTKVSGYIFVPGTTVWSSVPPLKCNVNSLTHETGHLLGLNDYYSYDTSDRTDFDEAFTGGALEGGLGGMDMMDVNMGDHNAFSKWLLGWLQPQIVEYDDITNLKNEERVFILHPSNESPEAIFIELMDSDSPFTEYLVVEVISSTMNAAEFTRLKNPMVRILHVEASADVEGQKGNWRGYGFRNDNSYTTTKFISMVEADGQDTVLNHLPSSAKLSYDIDDCFAEGDVLSPDSYPNTNGYDSFGNATVYNGLTIEVESISPEGEAVIRLGYAEKKESLEVVEIEPRPVIVPYSCDKPVCAASGTKALTFSFNGEIAVEESKIRVASGNEWIDGWYIAVEGVEMRIVFEEGLKAGRDYTVVIPQGAIVGADDPAVINNSNLIFGFVTEQEEDK